ncbi:MAG: hypothetical protein BGO76_06610 [Caedibacter sp. 38-128]|nr:hypothetical protein [Holosporales bacterium]OJX04604.1 MAG: hypothetical protein BGO76_06610 [Caedibacter sp. 38-128]
MRKKFLRACLIIACYAYDTHASSMLLPDQDLDGNPTPPAIRIVERDVENARYQVILGNVRMAQLNSIFSNPEESRARLGPIYQETSKRLHAAVDQMCTSAAGWSLVINFSVQHPETSFEADSSNPLWKLICEGLLNPQSDSPDILEAVYMRPMMRWVNEHGGWKAQTDIENASLQIELD